MRLMYAAGVLLLTGSLRSWTQEIKPETKTRLTGCVTRSKTVQDTLVLRSANSCTKVLGKLNATELIGHTASLEGVLTVATQKEPETLRVSGVTRVGEVCQDTCTLQPPGGRSMRKKENPTKDAATAGETSTKPKPEDTDGTTH